MKWCLKKKKIIALVLAEILLFNFNLYASDIDIPSESGTITEYFSGSSDKMIIHIQDAHSSYSGQKNLADIIRFLHLNYNIDTVAVEGAAGAIDLSEINCFPDSKAKKEVANYFLKKGYMDGSEYYSMINQDNPIALFGVENQTEYSKNHRAYLKTIPQTPIMCLFMQRVNDCFPSLKKVFYTPDLLVLDDIVGKFTNGEIDFLTYYRYVAQYAENHSIHLNDSENIACLKLLVEKYGEISVEKCIADAIEAVFPYMSETERTVLRKNEMRYCIHNDMRFFYNQLYNAIIGYSSYDSRIEYLSKYLNVYLNMDTVALGDDVSKTVDDLYNHLLTNKEQRYVYKLSRYLRNLEKLVQFRLTLRQYASFCEYNKPEKWLEMLNYLSAQSVQLDTVLKEFDLHVLQSHIDEYIAFYNYALSREKSICDNTLRLMNNKGRDQAILVTGGFHTSGIKKLLRKKGISYISVMPSIGNESEAIPYFSLLSNQQSQLETYMSFSYSTLKMASWLTQGLPLIYPERKPVLMSQMKMLLTTSKLHAMYIEALSKKDSVSGHEIADYLQQSIKEVLLTAGFEDDMSVDFVELNSTGMAVQISLIDNPTSFIVRFFEDTAQIPENSDDFIESVQIGGYTQAFSGIKAYLKYKNDSISLRSWILGILSESPKSGRDIYLSLKTKLRGLREKDLMWYLASLVDDELIEYNTKKEVFGFPYDSQNALVAHIIMALSGRDFDPAQSNVYTVQTYDLPVPCKDILQARSISSIQIDPTIALHDLVQVLRTIVNSVTITSGLDMSLSDKVRVSVFQSSADNMYSVRLYAKMPKRSVSGEELATDKSPQQIDSYLSRIADELNVIDNNISGYVVSDYLSDQEKAALIKYLSLKYVSSKEGSFYIERMLKKYLRIDDSISPVYTKKLGRAVFGRQFDSLVFKVFGMLRKIDPELVMKNTLRKKIAQAVFASAIPSRNKNPLYALIDQVQHEAVSHSGTLSKDLVENVIRTIKDREALEKRIFSINQFNTLFYSCLYLDKIKIKQKQVIERISNIKKEIELNNKRIFVQVKGFDQNTDKSQNIAENFNSIVSLRRDNANLKNSLSSNMALMKYSELLHEAVNIIQEKIVQGYESVTIYGQTVPLETDNISALVFATAYRLTESTISLDVENKLYSKQKLHDVALKYYERNRYKHRSNAQTTANEIGEPIPQGFNKDEPEQYGHNGHYYVHMYDKTANEVIHLDMGVSVGSEPSSGLYIKVKQLAKDIFTDLIPSFLHKENEDDTTEIRLESYSPSYVELVAKANCAKYARIFQKQNKKYSGNDDLLAKTELKNNESVFIFPDKDMLRHDEVKVEFAKMLHELSELSGVYISEQFFISNAHILQNSYASLLPFFIAVETDRLRAQRIKYGSTISSVENKIHEKGVVLVNTQRYLFKLGELFLSPSLFGIGLDNAKSHRPFSLKWIQNEIKKRKRIFPREAFDYLASSIGNVDGRVVRIYDPATTEPLLKEYDEKTIYTIGVLNRISGNHAMSYQAKVRADDSMSLDHRTLSPEDLKIEKASSLLNSVLKRFLEIARQDNLGIERLIVDDGNGKAPSSDPSKWKLMIITNGGGEYFFKNLQQYISTINGMFPEVNLSVDQFVVINKDDYDIIERFSQFNSVNNELSNYEHFMDKLNTRVESLIRRNLQGLRFSMKNIFLWPGKIKFMAGVLHEAGLLDPSQQYILKKLNSLENMIFTVDEPIMSFKGIFKRAKFFIKNGIFLFTAASVFAAVSSGFPFLCAFAAALFFIPSAVRTLNNLVLYFIYGLYLSFMDFSVIPLQTKLKLLEQSDYEKIKEFLGLNHEVYRNFSIIVDNIRDDKPFFSSNLEDMKRSSYRLRSAIRSAVVATPVFVDEEYITHVNDSGISFQHYNHKYLRTDLSHTAKQEKKSDSDFSSGKKQQHYAVVKKLSRFYSEDEMKFLLSKAGRFSTVDQVAILKNILKNSQKLRPGFIGAIRHFLKPSPGENKEYGKTLQKLAGWLTMKNKIILFFGAFLFHGTELVAEVALLHASGQSMYVILAVIAKEMIEIVATTYVGLQIGDDDFRKDFGLLSAFGIPVMYVIFSSISLLPITINLIATLVFLGVAGYIGGSLVGVFINNAPEIIYNGYRLIARILQVPIRLAMIRFLDKIERKKVVFSSAIHAINDANNSHQFNVVFEELMVKELTGLSISNGNEVKTILPEKPESLIDLVRSNKMEESSKQMVIDSLFEKFDPENPALLMEYLDSGIQYLPNPFAVLKNSFFLKLKNNFGSQGKSVFILSAIGLSAPQINKLENVFIRLRVISDVIAKEDIIVLDFDSLGWSYGENPSNQFLRKVLIEQISKIDEKYNHAGRKTRYIFYSDLLNSWQIKAVAGTVISGRIDAIYGKEIIMSMHKQASQRYPCFLNMIAESYNIRGINMKLYSTCVDMIDSAQKFGAIQVAEGASVLDVLTMFGDLHPENYESYKNLAGEKIVIPRHKSKTFFWNTNMYALFEHAA